MTMGEAVALMLVFSLVSSLILFVLECLDLYLDPDDPKEQDR